MPSAVVVLPCVTENATLAIGTELAPVAVAVTVSGMLIGSVVDEPGAVMATVGAVPTLTDTAAEVALVPMLLVATAVSETAPALAGVHDRLNGAVVLVPMATALARYCTLEIEPTVVAAVEVSVVATLIGSVALAAGAVIEIVGAVEPVTVTAIAELVVWLPAASVASAVSEYEPVVVGVHAVV